VQVAKHRFCHPAICIWEKICRPMGYIPNADRKAKQAAARFRATSFSNKFIRLNKFFKTATAAYENWHAF
jgi:hypothetical protein